MANPYKSKNYFKPVQRMRVSNNTNFKETNIQRSIKWIFGLCGFPSILFSQKYKFQQVYRKTHEQLIISRYTFRWREKENKLRKPHSNRSKTILTGLLVFFICRFINTVATHVEKILRKIVGAHWLFGIVHRCEVSNAKMMESIYEILRKYSLKPHRIQHNRDEVKPPGCAAMVSICFRGQYKPFPMIDWFYIAHNIHVQLYVYFYNVKIDLQAQVLYKTTYNSITKNYL